MGKIKSGEAFYDSPMALNFMQKSNRKPARDFKQLNDMMMKIRLMVGDL